MKDIIIDFGTRQIINRKIEAIQGDNTTKKVKILLKENSKAYSLEGKSVMLTMKKNSSDSYVNKGDFLTLKVTNATNGEVELPINKDFTKEKGGYQLQLSVLNEAEFEENSILFEAIIHTNLKEEISGTLVESVIFKEIKQTLQTVKDIEKNEQARQEAEKEREKKIAVISSEVENIQIEFDKAVANVTNGNESATNSEIVQARGKAVNLGARLNGIDSQLSENESNLTKNIDKTNNLEINKMDKDTTDIAIQQINKARGKIDQSYLTDELLQQIAGTVPINATPADNSILPVKNAYPTVVGKYISKNLIDINRAVQGYFVGYRDGDLNQNSNYWASDFIPVEPAEKYRINYNEQFAFYDADKNYVSGIPGSANAVITIPSGACYVRLSIKNSQLDTVQFEKGEKITSYESGSPVIPYNAIEKIANFYVGEDEYFKTITDAINYVKTLDNSKQYTIIIKDGIYLESLNLESNKNINIVGLNKETCIIEDRTGDYSNAPLTLNGNGYFKNLTLYSNHKNGTEYKLRGYAMHFEGDHDLGIETYCEFDNCKFISEQNSAIGVGMRKDETLKFKSCEFVQRSTDPYDAGSIYVHSSPFNHKNQHLIFENCIASNDSGFILGIDDANSMTSGENGAEIGDCTITFINNNFWSNTNGKNSSAVKLRGASASEGCIIGKIKLKDRSFGNNIAMLNR